MYSIISRALPGIIPLLLLVVGLTGCGEPRSEQVDAHDHGEPTPVTVTGWTADLEAFAEFHRPSADRPFPVVLYLTSLPEGRPLTQSVVLEWTGPDGQSHRDSVGQPLADGIYAMGIRLPAAGDWRLAVGVDGAAPEMLLTEIPVAATAHDAAHYHPEHDDTGEEMVTMTKEQQWLLGIAAEPATVRAYTHPLRVAAKVEAIPERRVVLRSEVAGLLMPLEGQEAPTLGRRVRAGETLLTVRVPLAGDAGQLVAADAELVRANQEFLMASAELERARSLHEAGGASRRRVEEAESALASARARQEAAQSLLDGRDPVRPVISPIDGVIVDIAAGSGAYLEAGGAILTILDADRVWVRGHIPETVLEDLPSMPLARLGFHGNIGEACHIEGAEFVYLSPEIDTASRTAAVVYEVDNTDGHLRPGQSLGLALATRTTTSGIVIPVEALVDEHGYPVVFVQVCGEEFIKRNVTLGGQDGQFALIDRGLYEGDRVVIQAPWGVKLAGTGSAAPGHGHTH